MRLTFVLALTMSALAGTTLAAEPVELSTPTGVLHGTLEVPSDSGPFPVALLIAGSGPTDRDGNSAPLGLVNNHLKLLADDLLDEGIASLRYDKRGIGQSSAASPAEEELRFTTYVADAQEWGKMLQRDSRFTGLYIIGHSEGSLIGMIAARRLKADGFVSIAGVGTRASDVIREQLAQNAPKSLRDRGLEITKMLEKGKTVAEVPPELNALFRPSVQPYLISWFRIDPVKVMRRLRCPALIIDGTTDIQVSARHAALLADANDNASRRRIEGMNHVLKMVSDNKQQQLASYGNPQLPIAEELVSAIREFIDKCQQRRGGRPLAGVSRTTQRQPGIVGRWKAVDFVRQVDDFSPQAKRFQGELFLKELQCFRDGRTSSSNTWKDEWIVEASGKAKAKYHLKTIDGSRYLFLPWLSGDVTLRGQKPSYYVLKEIP